MKRPTWTNCTRSSPASDSLPHRRTVERALVSLVVVQPVAFGDHIGRPQSEIFRLEINFIPQKIDETIDLFFGRLREVDRTMSACVQFTLVEAQNLLSKLNLSKYVPADIFQYSLDRKSTRLNSSH